MRVNCELYRCQEKDEIEKIEVKHRTLAKKAATGGVIPVIETTDAHL